MAAALVDGRRLDWKVHLASGSAVIYVHTPGPFPGTVLPRLVADSLGPGIVVKRHSAVCLRGAGPYGRLADERRDAMNVSTSREDRGAPADRTFGSPAVIRMSSSMRTPMPS
jgi:hypothetical protein